MGKALLRVQSRGSAGGARPQLPGSSSSDGESAGDSSGESHPTAHSSLADTSLHDDDAVESAGPPVLSVDALIRQLQRARARAAEAAAARVDGLTANIAELEAELTVAAHAQRALSTEVKVRESGLMMCGLM